MKRRLWRSHPRPLNNNPWASQPSPARTIGAMALLVIGLVLVGPAGAQAAAALQGVLITDPTDSTHKAHVDSNGNLQVTGNVSLTGTPTVNAQQTDRPLQSDEPGRYPFRADLVLHDISQPTYRVPDGKRLVIRYVSVNFSVFSPLVIQGIVFAPSAIVGPAVKTGSLNGIDYYVISQNTEIYQDSGLHAISPFWINSGDPFTIVGSATVLGYLIDCGSPCGPETIG